jgi:hypothetical protein
MVRRTTHGVCKRTGRTGKFVKSHLIPQAFTRPSIAGAFFISGGEGYRPKRNWTSWYDAELVTQEGEEILATYDNWAIDELKRLELVWSGWGGKSSLPLENWEGCPPKGYGIRQLECSNSDKLRLFFLSLLWRAAATTLPEFHAVVLDPNELERLRIMVLNGNPQPLEFYPTSLFQIITRGFDHNLSPVALDRGQANTGDGRSLHFRIFRFYFDGLIIYFHRNTGRDLLEIMPIHLVGFSPALRVQTQTMENSFQLANMKQHMLEGTIQWPEMIKKLTATREAAAPILGKPTRRRIKRNDL